MGMIDDIAIIKCAPCMIVMRTIHDIVMIIMYCTAPVCSRMTEQTNVRGIDFRTVWAGECARFSVLLLGFLPLSLFGQMRVALCFKYLDPFSDCGSSITFLFSQLALPMSCSRSGWPLGGVSECPFSAFTVLQLIPADFSSAVSRRAA